MSRLLFSGTKSDIPSPSIMYTHLWKRKKTTYVCHCIDRVYEPRLCLLTILASDHRLSLRWDAFDGLASLFLSYFNTSELLSSYYAKSTPFALSVWYSDTRHAICNGSLHNFLTLSCSPFLISSEWRAFKNHTLCSRFNAFNRNSNLCRIDIWTIRVCYLIKGGGEDILSLYWCLTSKIWKNEMQWTRGGGGGTRCKIR